MFTVEIEDGAKRSESLVPYISIREWTARHVIRDASAVLERNILKGL